MAEVDRHREQVCVLGHGGEARAEGVRQVLLPAQRHGPGDRRRHRAGHVRGEDGLSLKGFFRVDEKRGERKTATMSARRAARGAAVVYEYVT